MSKRFIFPQQSGDRKKPRLDISVSDHNFPLSQNAGSNNVADHFDDIDDELLLQASQACEQACNASMLPAYSQFMPPALTSTQLPRESSPSTSKGLFSFKKPNAFQTNTSTYIQDKCQRISSPLRGIAAKVGEIETIDLTNNYFNDKVLDIQDTDYVYRQLLQLKEENAKLKSENGKLLEKCVTKEGEASILRTQLKTYQIAVDNARLEKLKANEQVQIQWSEKLNAVNKQLFDIRTQLESKNLEIINIKEKCKMLESSKVNLTQITVAGNEMSRVNNSVSVSNNFLAPQPTRLETASATVQTESIPQFLKLNKLCRLGKTNVTQILPLIMDSATDHQHSILDYNEKLKRPTDFSPNKSRILSSFYRPSSSTDYVSNKSKVKINLSAIYESLMCIAACNNDIDKVQDHYIKIFDTTRTALESVRCELEMISKRLTSAFQKEMDKRYIETTTTYLVVEERDLICGKALFKEEQSILARRMTAVLQNILADAKAVQLFGNSASPPHQASAQDKANDFTNLLCRICALIDNNCCGLFYSGLLLAMVLLVETLVAHSQLHGTDLLEIVKHVISCRAMLVVPCRLLKVLCSRDLDFRMLCGDNVDNLKVDYEQGVLLFKTDSCILHVYLRQVEAAVKCMERQRLLQQVVETTRDLLQIYSKFTSSQNTEHKSRCMCGNLLAQVVVYALKICSTMLDTGATVTEKQSTQQRELLSVCRSGLRALYGCSCGDLELVAQLDYNEGNFIYFCEQLQRFEHNEFYSTMLSEMIGMFQAVPDSVNVSFSSNGWVRNFDSFKLTD